MRERGERREYAAMVARLVQSRRFGVRLELDRVERCLERLGSPERSFAVVVQVAGTNGKGSTAAMVESVLRAGGLVTGLFASPHLSRLTERFRVGGEELAPGELAEADRVVRAASGALGLELTFFEQLTVLAVVALAARRVEAAVFEVGLGGRLDATTAIGAQVAAVTGVALDHEEYLGSALADIACEKAGIFRAGQRAVLGASGEPEAAPILVAEARARSVASLAVVDEASIAAVPGSLGLAGAHQRRNAACALAIADAVEAHLGRPLSDGARARGLALCRLPGRLEQIADAPLVVVDGAHNPQAAATIAGELRALHPGAHRRVLVLGISRGKNAGGIAGPLCRDVDQVVATRAASDRAIEPAELAAAVRAVAPGLPVVEAPDCAAALTLARDLAGPGGAVLVAGSLFLAGEARQILLGDPADPPLLTDPLPCAS
jgi:dihydrofolate synthase/folylpolyglutamate synthase